MTYTATYTIGPPTTPAVIKWLIGLTCFFSLCTGLLDPLFLSFLQIQGPSYLFSLSFYGLKEGYLWQPFTYLFLENGTNGLSFEFLLILFFQMYFLWVMGSAVAEKIGSSAFAVFYVITGALCGIFAIFVAYLFGQSPQLMGPAASLFALFTFWAMMHPESDLLFFFILPVKTKWLYAGLFCALLLINLSQNNFSSLILYFNAAITAYIYGVITWDLHSSYSWMAKCDDILMAVKRKYGKLPTKKTILDDAKIVDIATGSPLLSDDVFVDAMLAKISAHGERSLSWAEKNRLKKISEKKSQHL